MGGVCWIPMAFLVNDSMMMVLVNEVIITAMDGSKATRVIMNIKSSAGTLPPFRPARRSFICLLPFFWFLVFLFQLFQQLDTRLADADKVHVGL